MIVPKGLGNTRSLDVAAAHFWLITGTLVFLLVSSALLAGAAAYAYERWQRAEQAAEELKYENVELARSAQYVEPAPVEGLAPDERARIEEEIRKEYEASNRALVTALSELFDEEARFRKINGYRPRPNSAADYIALSNDSSDGRGGPEELVGAAAAPSQEDGFRPYHVIYGLSNPSADLILQEIKLRTASLAQLRGDVLTARDKFERMPKDWPIRHASRRVTSNFGWRKDPFTHRLRHHSGTDISATYGSPVYATGRGVVVGAEWDGDYGRVVRIDHGDGYQTVYAHLSGYNVEVGEQVNRGAQIGRLGSSGRSTGPHLHYEVRISGKAVDARDYLP